MCSAESRRLGGCRASILRLVLRRRSWWSTCGVQRLDGTQAVSRRPASNSRSVIVASKPEIPPESTSRWSSVRARASAQARALTADHDRTVGLSSSMSDVMASRPSWVARSFSCVACIRWTRRFQARGLPPCSSRSACIFSRRARYCSARSSAVSVARLTGLWSRNVAPDRLDSAASCFCPRPPAAVPCDPAKLCLAARGGSPQWPCRRARSSTRHRLFCPARAGSSRPSRDHTGPRRHLLLAACGISTHMFTASEEAPCPCCLPWSPAMRCGGARSRPAEGSRRAGSLPARRHPSSSTSRSRRPR